MKRKVAPHKSHKSNPGKTRKVTLTPEEIEAQEVSKIMADPALTLTPEILKSHPSIVPMLRGDHPKFHKGLVDRGVFGKRLADNLTPDKIKTYISEWVILPSSHPEQSRESKYKITLTLTPEVVNRRGKVVTPAKVITLPNAMAMVNKLANVYHGDYHPNRAIRLIEKAGYKVEGERAVSFDSKEYLKRRAEKLAENEALRQEALRAESLVKAQEAIEAASNRKTRKTLPATIESILTGGGVSLVEGEGKRLMSQATRISRK